MTADSKARTWIGTRFPGVRYRQHPTRRHEVGPDKYYSIYLRVDGKNIEQGLGWASQGMTLVKAAGILNELRENIRRGEGPRSLKEKRQMAEEARQADEAARERERMEKMTFGDFFQNIYYPFAMAQKKKCSWVKEEQHFRRWISPVIGKIPLKAVSALHVERIKKNMSTGGMAPRSIEYVLATLRQVYRHARRIGHFQNDPPTAAVRKPKFDNRRMRFLTVEEVDRLLLALAARSQNLADMALISLHCGLRASEIFHLVWGDVDDQRGLMVLRDTKNSSTRHAIMTADVKAMLVRRGHGASTDLIFPATNGGPRKEIGGLFKQVVTEIGLNNGADDRRQQVCFHTLRHTFCARLLETGASLFDVRELLGHKTLVMVARYSHVGRNTLKEAVHRMESDAKSAPKAEVVKLVASRGEQ